MTAQVRPFVRVYYEIVDDPRFESVYSDDECLAWWLRLLIAADASWPSSAVLPRGVSDRALTVLVEAGLVETARGDRYRIHGLDKERDRQSAKGAAGAAARWGKPSPDAPASERDAIALPKQSAASEVAMHSAPLRSSPLPPLLARETPPARLDGGGVSAMQPLSELLPPPPGHRKQRAVSDA